MKLITIQIIRAYQVFLSPLLRTTLLSVFGVQFTCKSTPTCSEYTILQVKKHGTIIGLKKGLTRILACH